MIGYQWTIYHRHSGHGLDGMLAGGITEDPQKARGLVETILAEDDGAGCGLLVRVEFEGASPYGIGVVLEPSADWPPPGQVVLCRRKTDGGFWWGPLKLT
jgi:hypothetical protein